MAAVEEWKSLLSNLDVPPYNTRFDHVVQVVKVAKYLAKETGADLDVVVMAAWLHDVAKPGTGGVPDHGEAGAEKARVFLLSEGVDPVTVERVCDVIRKHVGLTLKAPLEPIEAQVVWEADKLSKLGLTGVVHDIIAGIRYDPYKGIDGILARMQNALPLCREIAASMNTEQAKRLAKDRIRSFEHFIKSLENELNL